MASNIEDKNTEPINKGDHVWTRIRGGRHEGDVERIVTTAKDAEKEEVKNPPKVLFEDQHGHRVAHNPGTLEHK
ncbi:lipase [Fusarium mundagurra]|uniref:Lipase n=1 Tax=Fusarium mundagurra TaxID=1567541 RepID=A0A8H5Z509_9HYPO|nr:lipase [Fusarium mundagurra]